MHIKRNLRHYQEGGEKMASLFRYVIYKGGPPDFLGFVTLGE